MVAHNFVQVNRLWWYIAEQFLYSTFYFGKEEWRVQKFIDTIKSKPDLAGQLRTLGIMIITVRRRVVFAHFLNKC